MGKTISIFQIKSEEMVDWAITFFVNLFFENGKIWVVRATVN